MGSEVDGLCERRSLTWSLTYTFCSNLRLGLGLWILLTFVGICDIGAKGVGENVWEIHRYLVGLIHMSDRCLSEPHRLFAEMCQDRDHHRVTSYAPAKVR